MERGGAAPPVRDSGRAIRLSATILVICREMPRTQGATDAKKCKSRDYVQEKAERAAKLRKAYDETRKAARAR